VGKAGGTGQPQKKIITAQPIKGRKKTVGEREKEPAPGRQGRRKVPKGRKTIVKGQGPIGQKADLSKQQKRGGKGRKR